jgi:hypothetical protein
LSSWVGEFLSGKLYALISFQITVMYISVLIVSKVSPVPGMAILTFCDFARLFTNFKRRQSPLNMKNIHLAVNLENVILSLAEISILFYLIQSKSEIQWIVLTLIGMSIASSIITSLILWV